MAQKKSKTTDGGLAVEVRRIEDIVPYARNPRKNEAAVAKVMASLKEFGWRQPIVVDPEMVIVAGHTRYEAAKRLGWTTAPVHMASGLTPAQIKAYRLADNRTAQEAEWDNELLGLEIKELRGFDFDLSATGFGDDEIAEILGAAATTDLPGLPTGDKAPFQQMTFQLHDDQAEQVKAALAQATAMGPFDGTGNENSNGNALARICETFLTHAGSESATRRPH